MKFGFVTCVKLGLSCIETIFKIGGKLELLVTLHDNKSQKKSGRIYLDKISEEQNVELLKINHVNDDELLEAIKSHEIDWLFIIGWSQIAGSRILNAPRRGVIGMHPTLLPQGRGRASIPWAIIKGIDKTGVTMFKMDEGVDTGFIIAQEEIEIGEDEIATTLYEKVNLAHETLIEKTWENLIFNKIIFQRQDDSKATYWDGRTPKDGEIMEKMTVEMVDRLVRATTHPYPGAFYIKDNMKYIIWRGTKTISDKNLYKGYMEINLKDGSYFALDYEIS